MSLDQHRTWHPERVLQRLTKGMDEQMISQPKILGTLVVGDGCGNAFQM